MKALKLNAVNVLVLIAGFVLGTVATPAHAQISASIDPSATVATSRTQINQANINGGLQQANATGAVGGIFQAAIQTGLNFNANLALWNLDPGAIDLDAMLAGIDYSGIFPWIDLTGADFLPGALPAPAGSSGETVFPTPSIVHTLMQTNINFGINLWNIDVNELLPGHTFSDLGFILQVNQSNTNVSTQQANAISTGAEAAQVLVQNALDINANLDLAGVTVETLDLNALLGGIGFPIDPLLDLPDYSSWLASVPDPPSDPGEAAIYKNAIVQTVVQNGFNFNFNLFNFTTSDPETYYTLDEMGFTIQLNQVNINGAAQQVNVLVLDGEAPPPGHNPEPGSLALLGTGIAGLFAARRRRAQSATL